MRKDQRSVFTLTQKTNINERTKNKFCQESKVLSALADYTELLSQGVDAMYILVRTSKQIFLGH